MTVMVSARVALGGRCCKHTLLGRPRACAPCQERGRAERREPRPQAGRRRERKRHGNANQILAMQVYAAAFWCPLLEARSLQGRRWVSSDGHAVARQPLRAEGPDRSAASLPPSSRVPPTGMPLIWSMGPSSWRNRQRVTTSIEDRTP
ncbi:unnamed protein product [Prorocentrum cordatum]|uniref:Uncharacterized protein n=1 Tax=Prorocentrum cordatum TaxID=2364126 RepID=A0ABN9WF12_9DINO|nr:unnamed protein product [Polarella glacialis]